MSSDEHDQLHNSCTRTVWIHYACRKSSTCNTTHERVETCTRWHKTRSRQRRAEDFWLRGQQNETKKWSKTGTNPECSYYYNFTSDFHNYCDLTDTQQLVMLILSLVSKCMQLAHAHPTCLDLSGAQTVISSRYYCANVRGWKCDGLWRGGGVVRSEGMYVGGWDPTSLQLEGVECIHWLMNNVCDITEPTRASLSGGV